MEAREVGDHPPHVNRCNVAAFEEHVDVYKLVIQMVLSVDRQG